MNMPKFLIVTFENGQRYGIPVGIIAMDRAAHFAQEFGDDIERSLLEDTAPLFEASTFEVMEWAQNNMNWKDLEPFAIKLKHRDIDLHREWSSADLGLSEDIGEIQSGQA